MPTHGFSSRHYAEQAMLRRYQQAAAAMGSLRCDPDSWQRVHQVILKTKHAYTRAFAASTLAFALQYQWDRIPPPAKEGIKKWALSTIASVAAQLQQVQQPAGAPPDPRKRLQRRQVHEFLRCLAQVVLNAAKHCWPKEWAGLTPSLIAIARKSEGACGASLEVFKRLAEDVYPAGVLQDSLRSADGRDEAEGVGKSGGDGEDEDGAMATSAKSVAVTTAAMRRLQGALRAEVPRILTLLKQVLDMAKSPDLVATALSCLGVYVPLCPLPVLLAKKDGMVGVLLRRHLLNPRHRAQALACISEIGRRRVGSWATDLGGQDKDDVSSGCDFLRDPDAMMQKAVAAGRGVRLPGKKKGPVGSRSAGGGPGAGPLPQEFGDSDSDEDLAAAEAGADEPDDPSGYGVSLTPAYAREVCDPKGIADGVGAALAAVMAQAIKILPRGDARPTGPQQASLDGRSAVAQWSLETYDSGNPGQTQYVAALSGVLTSLCNGRWGFFHTRGPPARRLLASACELQAELMSVSHDEATFYNAVDFWKSASEALLRSARHVARRSRGAISDLSVLFAAPDGSSSGSPAKGEPKLTDFSMYRYAVERVRKVCVARMGKPKEVLLVVDEDTGEIERQERTDLHELAIFRDLRRILRNLTPLGGRDTVGLLLKRLDACNATTRSLAEQAASSKHSQDAPEAAMRLLQEQLRHRTSINKLCWSLGAVSGTLPPDIEARFLVTSIKGLLDMTDRARGRDDKGVVASGIMYVCGQYPRFLRKHWKFLETVTDKLCEFCGETRSPAVQDMAVEHLLRISKACAESFVAHQSTRQRPYIVDLCNRSAAVCANLAPHQAETFFKSCGAVLAKCPVGKAADSITDRLLDAPMQQWTRVVTAAHSTLQVLQAPDSSQTLARLAKLLRAVASETGPRFARPLGRVFLDSVNLMRALSAFILRTATGAGGPPALRSDSGRAMRGARKALLEMVRSFVRTAGKDAPGLVVKEFLPHIVPRLTEHLQQASESEQAAATAEPAAIALLRDCCRGELGVAIAGAGHLGKIATAAADSIVVAFNEAGARASAAAASAASLPTTVRHGGHAGGRARAGAGASSGPASGSSSGGDAWGGWGDGDGDASGEEQLESVGGRSVELRQRYLSLCTALLATRDPSGEQAGKKSLFAASVAAMGQARTVAVCEMGIDAALSADRRLSGPGLRLLVRLVRGFQAAPASFSQMFFRAEWLRIASTVLVALTDRMHAGDMDAHATLIGELFAALESRAIGGPLWRDGGVDGGGEFDAETEGSAEGDGGGPAKGKFGSNEEWVGYHLGVWLGTSFPHLGKERVVAFAGGLARAGAAMAGEADPAAVRATHAELKRLLADFAVESLQLRPKEAAELFAEDPIAAAAALGVDVVRD